MGSSIFPVCVGVIWFVWLCVYVIRVKVCNGVEHLRTSLVIVRFTYI